MKGKSTPKYTEEFKQTIVNLYQSGKTYSWINVNKVDKKLRNKIS